MCLACQVAGGEVKYEDAYAQQRKDYRSMTDVYNTH